MCAPAPRRARARWRYAFERAARGRASTPGRCASSFDRALVEPGADRASDRSAAQEHADPRARDRRAARRARARSQGDEAELAGNEERLRARHPDPVAHQHAAPDAAEGDRRSRQRPLLLRLHVLPRVAAPLRRTIEDELARQDPAGGTGRSPLSCASARGSAATATAIPSSPPRCCNEAMRLQSARALGHLSRRIARARRRAVARAPASCR